MNTGAYFRHSSGSPAMAGALVVGAIGFLILTRAAFASVAVRLGR